MPTISVYGLLDKYVQPARAPTNSKPRRKKYHQPEIFDLCSAMQGTERKQRSTCVLPICSAKQPRHDQQQPTTVGLVNHRSTRVGSATALLTCIKSTVRPSLNWESQHAMCNNTDEASATAWSRQKTTILSLSDGGCSPSAVRRAPFWSRNVASALWRYEVECLCVA